MKIGVISAMESEHRRLVACLEGAQEVRKGIYTYVCGKLGDNEAILTRCGIGKVNAAVGAAELVRFFAPDCIVSTGVAGGIDASLRVMDVVAASEVVYHDVWCGMGNAYGQVQGLPPRFTGRQAFPLFRRARAGLLPLDPPVQQRCRQEGDRVHNGLHPHTAVQGEEPVRCGCAHAEEAPSAFALPAARLPEQCRRDTGPDNAKSRLLRSR